MLSYFVFVFRLVQHIEFNLSKQRLRQDNDDGIDLMARHTYWQLYSAHHIIHTSSHFAIAEFDAVTVAVAALRCAAYTVQHLNVNTFIV